MNRIATADPALRASAFAEAGIRQKMAAAIVDILRELEERINQST